MPWEGSLNPHLGISQPAVSNSALIVCGLGEGPEDVGHFSVAVIGTMAKASFRRNGLLEAHGSVGMSPSWWEAWWQKPEAESSCLQTCEVETDNRREGRTT